MLRCRLSGRQCRPLARQCRRQAAARRPQSAGQRLPPVTSGRSRADGDQTRGVAGRGGAGMHLQCRMAAVGNGERSTGDVRMWMSAAMWARRGSRFAVYRGEDPPRRGNGEVVVVPSGGRNPPALAPHPPAMQILHGHKYALYGWLAAPLPLPRSSRSLPGPLEAHVPVQAPSSDARVSCWTGPCGWPSTTPVRSSAVRTCVKAGSAG